MTLELGGKSPNIVFEDADLDAAANGVVAGIFAATGQTCMAGSRLFVQDTVHDEFVERLAARAREIRSATRWTRRPRWARSPSRVTCEKVMSAIGSAQAEGAAAGHRRRPARWAAGYFVEPTIFGDVTNGMDIARNEIFGPVLAALRFSDEDGGGPRWPTPPQFGLAAGVWTRDVQRAHRMARALRAGTVWVNAYRAVGPMAPFGGFKASRHRARERPSGDRRVHRAQDGLDRAHRRDARSVPARLSADDAPGHGLLTGSSY